MLLLALSQAHQDHADCVWHLLLWRGVLLSELLQEVQFGTDSEVSSCSPTVEAQR